MSIFKGIVKSIKGGLKMIGTALPALGVMLGMSLMFTSCSIVMPNETKYQSYKDTEAFKEVYMEDVAKATEAFKEGYITNAEYQARMDRFDSESYLKEKIIADTENPEYKEALDKANDGYKYLYAGIPTMFVAGFGSAVFYSLGARAVVNSAKDDFIEAGDEFKKKRQTKPKTAKGATKFASNDDEEELPNIEDDYYND